MGLMSFTFGEVNSEAYGVYISGHGTFNAPIRRGESVIIPGRNGSFFVDEGAFENAEVTYPAFIVKTNQPDFSEAISDFRNALAAQKGYVRLTDTYHPDEYRLALYRGGLEVETVMSNVAGNFNIVFECKPQRFLTSGETALDIASGGSLTNPTLFDARPILKVDGYGEISLGGQNISVDYIPVGDVLLADSLSFAHTYPSSTAAGTEPRASFVFDANLLNTGDNIYIGPTSFSYDLLVEPLTDSFSTFEITSQSGAGATSRAVLRDSKRGSFLTTFSGATFVKGTASSVTHSFQYHYIVSGSGTSDASGPRQIILEYDGNDTITLKATNDESSGITTVSATGTLGTASGYSTLLASGTITIDLDIGEASFEHNGATINANYAVTIGAELPVLEPGATTVNYDNTFSSFKVIPNWWKI